MTQPAFFMIRADDKYDFILNLLQDLKASNNKMNQAWDDPEILSHDKKLDVIFLNKNENYASND